MAFKSSSSIMAGAGVCGASAGAAAAVRGGGGWFSIWKTSLPSTVVADIFWGAALTVGAALGTSLVWPWISVHPWEGHIRMTDRTPGLPSSLELP